MKKLFTGILLLIVFLSTSGTNVVVRSCNKTGCATADKQEATIQVD